MRWTLPTIALMMGMVDATYSEIKDIQWKIGPNIPEFRKGGCATALDGKDHQRVRNAPAMGRDGNHVHLRPGAGLVVQRHRTPLSDRLMSKAQFARALSISIGGRMRGVRNLTATALRTKGTGSISGPKCPI